jgi:hypothetical protein
VIFQVAAFVLAYGGAIACLAVTVRSEHLRDKPRFQLAAVVWGVSTSGWLVALMLPSPMALLAAIPAGLLWGASYAYFFATFVVRLRTWGMGDENLVVLPTFDKAEAAERRKDFQGALRLYQEAAAAHPGNAEIRRRLGEAYLRVADEDQGLMELRAAMGLVADPEKKMTVAFRVVEILMGKKKDVFNAEMILQSLERDHPGKIADLARARRARLRE